MKRFILLMLLLAATAGWGQSFVADRAMGVNPFNPGLVPLGNAPVRVCTLPTASSPCNTPATTITDIFGNPKLIVGGNFGQITTDIVGRFNFGCIPGNYQIQVAASGTNTPQLNYQITCPASTGGVAGVIANKFLVLVGNNVGLQDCSVTGQVPVWNNGTLTWACGTAATTFDQVGPGTNTNALVMGTGGSLLPSGGQIQADGLRLSNTTPTPTAPSPLFTTVCQNNPQAWLFDPVAAKWSDQMYIETTQPGGNFPAGVPPNTLTFCRRLWFNDTGLAQFGRNAIISVYHQFGNQLSNAADDRPVVIRTETTTSDTGAHTNSRIQGIYLELGLKGSPTGFGSGPDQGQNAIRSVIDDTRNGGGLTTTSVALDGSYQDNTTGGANMGGCGLVCAIGVRGTASGAAANGASFYNGGVFQATTSVGGNAGTGIGVQIVGPAIRFSGANIGLYFPTCGACNGVDTAVRQDSVQPNVWGGSFSLGGNPAILSNQSTMNVTGSFLNTGGLGALAFSAPPATNVSQGGAAGATTYSYVACVKDGNGGRVCGIAGTTNTGNATLSGSNFNNVSVGAPAIGGATSYDVYRTACGGAGICGTNPTGKIGSVTPAFTAGSITPIGNLIFSDTGFAGDASTVPVGNSTGSVAAADYATNTNCAAVGTAADPSVASCAVAAAGSFSCATNLTNTCTVNTDKAYKTSQIFIQQRTDTVTGTRLGVTCNTTLSTITTNNITAVVDGVSFSFTLTKPVTNPDCFSYHIVN